MRRITHTLLGAAVAMPTAVSHDPIIAAACLWWGMAGGGLPDWFDLRSDLRGPLRLQHRGISHSIVFLIVVTGLVLGLFTLLRASGFALAGVHLIPPENAVVPWLVALALGIASHLASDACTHGGIRPLLPFSRARVWLLPGFLRSRFDGYLDTVFRLAAIAFIGVGSIAYVGERLS
ncbi:MAG TPA: metal-dependent hydrolase [Thermomicrobiales bacterium]|nr:metal-dependent hydrolase [Thermomicrobiales bacterium]